MKQDDLVRLRHMLDAGAEASGFVAGKARKDLDGNRMLVLSLVKCIEIIGEAASRIGEEMRREHPEVPWSEVVGMRNRMVHGYYEIDPDRVWDTVTDDLPRLMEQLSRLIPG